MSLFILQRLVIGGEPEDDTGIREIIATGDSRTLVETFLPKGCAMRTLTEDEDSYLEYDVSTAFIITEIKAPGLAGDGITTCYYPRAIGT